jgi:aryl-alcohol dehydrogenase-like predicted oxidoreductase
MNYAYLGNTGVQVSELCLGTMTFGNEADETTSRAIMDRSLEAGINFFDTANIYNGGLTEEIVGRWIGPHRDDIVLATKAHFPMGEGINNRGSSRRHLIMSVEQSLKRLQTDRVDILYLHHWDSDTAIEETLMAMTSLVEQGKVHYCAVSNFAAWQTVRAIAATEAKRLAPVVCIQPMYNLLKRQAEVEIFPMAQREGIGVCPYSPIAAGMLTGKYLRGETGRIDENAMYTRRYNANDYPAICERFVQHADSHGHDPAALAVRWVLNHPAVTSALIGARNLDQLNTALGTVDLQLNDAERQAISDLGINPPRATDREA